MELMIFVVPGLVLLASIVISVIGKINTRRAMRKAGRVSNGWEKLFRKLIDEGWIPPENSKWFGTYIQYVLSQENYECQERLVNNGKEK